MLEKILKWLSGKKGVIASVIALLNGYFLAKSVYGDLEFYLIGGLQIILFGAASIKTKLIYKK